MLVTKTDLADPAALVAEFAPLDVTFVTTARGEDLGGLRAMLLGRTTVAVGHSGVGKSTLVNVLVPDARRATGVVNAVTGRGRHTSSSSVALRLHATDEERAAGLPAAGWVIDTPGIRSFGLGHVDPATFIQHFDDLAPGTEGCPRGCSHDEADCALDAWVTEGHAGDAGPARLESLRRLLRSRTGDERP